MVQLVPPVELVRFDFTPSELVGSLQPPSELVGSIVPPSEIDYLTVAFGLLVVVQHI